MLVSMKRARARTLALPIVAALLLCVARASADDAPGQQMWQQAQALLQRNQIQAALPYLREAARQGNPRAQAALGNMYHDGDGVPKDDNTARQWYQLAAAQGHRFAKYSLGNMYMLGLGGLPVDQARATELFEASARQGLVDAQEAVAVSYELGRGTLRNRSIAIYWLDQAAKQDDIFARGFAKILRNPNTPTFTSVADIQDFVTAVFGYCWRDQFPVHRFDLDSPGVEVWEHKIYNWRNTYCN